jgi:FKBP12-rapamycin complex-associated protein
MGNIIIKSQTEKLVNIDFGDCFEVAQKREREPELIPFRLTRILVNSLEASKIEGIFRHCFENVMSLIRSFDEEILGLFEVFLYDPLLQWIQEGSNDESVDSNAKTIIARIRDKLKGTNLGSTVVDYPNQVEKLI